jgi:hypothetical protein
MLILGFIIVVIQVTPAHGTQAFPNSPLPAPSVFNSPLPIPTSCPLSTNQADLVIDTTIGGLNGQDAAELQLLSDTSQTANCLSARGISLPNLGIHNEGRRITVTNIPDGSYKLIIRAPANYFREPQGYLFRISKGQVVRTSNLAFQFKLIPPTAQKLPPCRDYSKDSTQQQNISPNNISAKECLAERIIDVSGPHKAPVITSQNTPDASYFYAHVHDTSTSWGVWGRMSVSDPEIPHGSENHHIVEHVYATLDYQKWIEAGWAEVNWRDDRQYIFQFDSTNQTWNFYDQYSIAKGDKVTVLVQNDGGTYWKAVLYRSGVYNVLARVDVGFTSVPHTFNGFENASISGDPSIMPPSHFDEAYLYSGSVWRTWETYFLSTSSTQVDSPFLLGMKRQFYDFYVNSPIVFLPLVIKDAP